MQQVIGKDGEPRMVKKKRKPEPSAAALHKVHELLVSRDCLSMLLLVNVLP